MMSCWWWWFLKSVLYDVSSFRNGDNHKIYCSLMGPFKNQTREKNNILPKQQKSGWSTYSTNKYIYIVLHRHGPFPSSSHLALWSPLLRQICMGWPKRDRKKVVKKIVNGSLWFSVFIGIYHQTTPSSFHLNCWTWTFSWKGKLHALYIVHSFM